jgi:hypothetical protein
MAKIDPTISTIQEALRILGSHDGFTTKVVTLQVMTEMHEIVKQQPRDQREAHWRRLLQYLQRARYELPELPRQWPPDPGDELRNERERGTEESDVNIFCRGEQNGQGTDDLARNQDRSKVVQQVWRDALTKLCLDRQMPWPSAYASDMRRRDSSSQTTRTECDSQMLRIQEGAGAPNRAEQSRQQRIDLPQADGRLESHSQQRVLAGTVGLTGTSIYADSECFRLPERSSDHRVTIANAGNEDKSNIDLRSIESQGNPIRSPVEAHVDFVKSTTELVTNAPDLSAREQRPPASCDATQRPSTAAFYAWQCYNRWQGEDDILRVPREMNAARACEQRGYKLGPRDSWFAYIENGMPMNPTGQQLHECMRHYSSSHLWWTMKFFNGREADESFDMTVNGMRLSGSAITRAHMEMPDGVKCTQCENGRIQAIGLHDMGRAGDTEAPLAGSIETASGTKRDIESTPESADGRADASSAKRMRGACAGTVLEVPDGRNAAPISVDGASSVKLVPEPLQYNDAKVKLELPVEDSNTSEALHFQSFNVQQVAAHVALIVHESPAEHAAQAESFGARTVQRDNAKSVEPVQHASIEGRVEYGGAMNRGSRARATLTDREIRCKRAYGD